MPPDSKKQVRTSPFWREANGSGKVSNRERRDKVKPMRTMRRTRKTQQMKEGSAGHLSYPGKIAWHRLPAG
jgi:hypothetical protein